MSTKRKDKIKPVLVVVYFEAAGPPAHEKSEADPPSSGLGPGWT